MLKDNKRELTQIEKKCLKCNKMLPKTEEFFYRKKTGYLTSPCKECIKKQNSKKWRYDPDKKKEYRKKHREATNKWREKQKEKEDD